MKSIAEAISDLLYVRDTVVVPGLGAFVKKSISAQVNPVANYFTTPSCVVEFDGDLREDNELIINYIAGENDIPVDEAKRLLAIFVSDCFSKLKKGDQVSLTGIGTLRYDWHSNIVLDQDASSNFNSDAFGLTDFTAVPVIHSVTKAEIKAEIEQQQWEKNTPVTVDEKAIHEGDKDDEGEDDNGDNDDYRPRRPFWPWLLLILFLVAGAVIGLQYFGIYNFKKWFIPKEPFENPVIINEPEKPIEPAPIESNDTIMVPENDTLIQNDTLQIQIEQPIENTDPIQVDVPTEPEQPIEEVKPVEEAKPIEEEGKILIVAGCFSNEVYAQNMLTKLKNEGHQSALIEKHGSKWFVAYGRYRTDAEAAEAYQQIKANVNDKVWIRK